MGSQRHVCRACAPFVLNVSDREYYESSDFQEINEHARRNSFGSTNSAVENKFAESTQTLTYEERRAYTRGIDELVDHLKHSLRDEWEARDLEWTHWNGDAKTAKSEWQYVNGPAVSSDKVLRRSLSDVAEGEGDAPKAIRGRDDNNHGVTVEGFQRRINSSSRSVQIQCNAVSRSASNQNKVEGIDSSRGALLHPRHCLQQSQLR